VNANKQFCPICNAEVKPIQRYPDYVCDVCTEKAVDSEGRRVLFANEGISGGLIAFRAVDRPHELNEDRELTDNPICFIDGIRCIASEAHFGGVVIRKAK
jgi:hypothetical protein